MRLYKVIDATTEAGYGGTPLVTLDGTLATATYSGERPNH